MPKTLMSHSDLICSDTHYKFLKRYLFVYFSWNLRRPISVLSLFLCLELSLSGWRFNAPPCWFHLFAKLVWWCRMPRCFGLYFAGPYFFLNIVLWESCLILRSFVWRLGWNLSIWWIGSLFRCMCCKLLCILSSCLIWDKSHLCFLKKFRYHLDLRIFDNKSKLSWS